jgi:hypothetical protein
MARPARRGVHTFSGSAVIARLRQIAFGSQVKIVLALALPTSVVIFASFFILSLAGIPLSRSGRDPGTFVLVLVALFLGAAILLCQLAALALLRLLPWRGPRLEIEIGRDEEELRRVFE